jgi:hypothetical protein
MLHRQCFLKLEAMQTRFQLAVHGFHRMGRAAALTGSSRGETAAPPSDLNDAALDRDGHGMRPVVG